MYLDYSQIAFDQYGRPEAPTLLLQTKDERTIGAIPNATNLKFNIKYSEPSEISFELPAFCDGQPTSYYDQVVGYKLIRTEHYGIYQIMKPEIKGNGLEQIKSVTGYSIEKGLEGKQFFLEEGTFNFWNPVDSDDTVLGRVLEVSPGWKVGYVSPTLIGRYRTFDQYDNYVLSFLYDDCMTTYRCVIVFDPYKKTISAYDADEEVSTLPIYLGFDNLVEELDVTELTDELVTAMTPTGADDLDIRDVNPTGTNWIYDISYFVSNGDIPADIAEKWEAWQKSVLNRREYYRGLVALRASGTARLLSEQAVLTDLKAELDDLTNQQSVTIQALALETTTEGKAATQSKLDEISAAMTKKQNAIAKQESVIEEIKKSLDASDGSSYNAKIKVINDELKLSNYFTDDEYATLQSFFIEQSLQDETFVASDVDTSNTGTSSILSNASISVEDAKISRVDFGELSKQMHTITGGNAKLFANTEMNADIIRGTLECKSDNTFVLSLYCGTIKVSDKTNPSGLITATGSLSDFASDIQSVTDQEVTTYEGTALSFKISSATLYMTTNVSEYQKYSVQMELYDYAVQTLSEVASPTYEFSVDTGNFIFAKEFQQYRKNLDLGKGIYLRLHNDEVITPVLIEFELDFENREKLSLTFSNRFKRHDNVRTLKDMIESGYSTSRSFDASKHIYNQTANQASKVSDFMNGQLNAAVNTVLGAENQSVVINGAGIQVGGNSDYEIRIIDSMIAIINKKDNTAKVAIGRFAADELGEHWGINSEILAGKLLIGNALMIEAPNDQGVMQFKLDSGGAWLYNSTFVLAKDGGGKILIDPRYGIAAGSGDLYTTSGTTVTPSFIGEDGKIIFDDDVSLKGLKIPKNANFYIDADTGKAYFRGNIYAEDGIFNGTVYAKDGEFTGKVTATSGKFTGEIEATSGTFSGTIKASTLDGTLTGGQNGGAITGVSLDIGNGAFKVDSNGNVTIKNGNISWGAVTGTDEIDNKIQNAQNTANSASSAASTAQNKADSAQSAANSAQQSADNAQDDAETAISNVKKLANGQTISGVTGTFISGTTIKSPTIEGNQIIVNGYFQTKDNENIITGYMGSMAGRDANNSTTYGVGISANINSSLQMVAPYIIVTTAGIRLQADGYKLVVTSSGVSVNNVAIGTATFG